MLNKEFEENILYSKDVYVEVLRVSRMLDKEFEEKSLHSKDAFIFSRHRMRDQRFQWQ